MKIVLLGYMASGKSSLGKLLAEQLQMEFIDLDSYIATQLKMSIPDVFQNKGEIYFRKIENECLQEVLAVPDERNIVLALGGGTPCYYNNIDLVLQATNTISFYLKLDIESILHRLWSEKETRPLIAHYKDKNGLEDFIRKHLFERQFYYLKANHTLALSNLSLIETVELIQLKIK